MREEDGWGKKKGNPNGGGSEAEMSADGAIRDEEWFQRGEGRKEDETR